MKYFLVIFLLVFVVFGRSLFFDYIHLDEDVLITGNSYFYKSKSVITEVFKHNVYYPTSESAYYRPIYVLSFVLDTYLGGSARVFHLTNIVLHVLATFLLFLFLKELKLRPWAFVLSLFFAVHPIVVQAVSWIPARGDTLLTIFLLSSLLLLPPYFKKGGGMYLSGHLFFYILALFSKETALSLPVFGVFYLKLILDKKLTDKKCMIVFISWLATTLCWYFLREYSVKIDDPSVLKIAAILINNLPASLIYLGKMMLPFNLSVYPLFSSSNVIYGAITLSIIVGYALLNRFKLSKQFFIGLLWLILFMFPVLLNYDNPDQMAIFEHRIYPAFIGFLILLSDPISKLNLKYVKTLSYIIVPILMFVSYSYSLNFKDASAYWDKAVKDSPRSARARIELASIYVSRDKFAEAEDEYLKASEINSQEKNVHNNLALLYIKQELFEKAELELLKEISIDPFSVNANFNLGNLYARTGKLEKSKPYWLEVVKINPNHILTYESLVKYSYLHKNINDTLYYINEITKRGAPLSDEVETILRAIKL